MFGRLLWRLLRGNRGRLAVALVAMASGAAVISALFNMQFDVQRKMTQEFRTLGANVVIAPAKSFDDGATLDRNLLNTVEMVAGADVAKAPYLYIVARTDANRPVVLAGTWLNATSALRPYWKIDGEHAPFSSEATSCLVGTNVARQFGLKQGSELRLHYGANEARLIVAGIITAGGAEDNEIVASLPVVQDLASLRGRISLIELRVPGTAQEIQAVADRLQAASGDVRVEPIRQIAQAEGALLGRVRLLIISMSALIFVLTALSVLATMTALAMERRADVGLMKALGGSIGRIVALFLAEVSVLGIAGGVVGYLIGALLTIWIGRSVFGAAITPRVEVLPLIVALMVGVALAGALPLRLLGRVKPAVILRGE